MKTFDKKITDRDTFQSIGAFFKNKDFKMTNNNFGETLETMYLRWKEREIEGEWIKHRDNNDNDDDEEYHYDNDDIGDDDDEDDFYYNNNEDNHAEFVKNKEKEKEYSILYFLRNMLNSQYMSDIAKYFNIDWPHGGKASKEFLFHSVDLDMEFKVYIDYATKAIGGKDDKNRFHNKIIKYIKNDLFRLSQEDKTSLSSVETSYGESQENDKILKDIENSVLRKLDDHGDMLQGGQHGDNDNRIINLIIEVAPDSQFRQERPIKESTMSYANKSTSELEDIILGNEKNTEALFQLGMRYYEGNGVTPSSSTALEYITDAADRGHKQALELLPMIEDMLG